VIRVSRSLIPRVLHNPQCTTTPNQGSAALRRGSTGLGTHAGWNRGRQRMGRRWRHPRPGTAWRPDWPRDHRRGAQEVVGGGLVTGRLQQIDDDTAARGHRARLSRLARRRPRIDAGPEGRTPAGRRRGDASSSPALPAPPRRGRVDLGRPMDGCRMQPKGRPACGRAAALALGRRRRPFWITGR